MPNSFSDFGVPILTRKKRFFIEPWLGSTTPKKFVHFARRRLVGRRVANENSQAIFNDGDDSSTKRRADFREARGRFRIALGLFILRIPFSGDKNLLRYPASGFAGHIPAELVDDAVLVTYRAGKPDAEAIKREFNNQISRIETSLEFVRGPAQEWNNRLVSIGCAASDYGYFHADSVHPDCPFEFRWPHLAPCLGEHAGASRRHRGSSLRLSSFRLLSNHWKTERGGIVAWTIMPRTLRACQLAPITAQDETARMPRNYKEDDLDYN